MNPWPWFIFTIAAGACVGSFLNVVILRLPAGTSIIRPPSRCPNCGHKLAWYDNVPVLGWLWLGGRCRYCKNPISIQYPLIEALTAVLFGLLFYVYYMTNLRPAYYIPGIGATWPVFVVNLLLLGSLIAATKIDARLFIIPLGIPWTITIIAFAVLPVTVWLVPPSAGAAPILAGLWIGPALGGLVGLAVAVALLRLGVIPLSFAEEPQQSDPSPATPASERSHDENSDPPDNGWLRISTLALAVAALWFGPWGILIGVILAWVGVLVYEQSAEVGEEVSEWLSYPHPRREMLKELLFLLPVVLGAALGAALTWRWGGAGGSTIPEPVRALAGVALGYLAGGGIVWLVRILGTLMFGREAMGLGDVHLMGAVGAVLGPIDAILAFFIAPFIGLSYILLTVGLASVLKKRFHPVPYGPHLAAASVVVMIFRVPILGFLGII